MYSSDILTAVDPRPHLMISIDGATRHLGPHRKGCLRASKQLHQTPNRFYFLPKLRPPQIGNSNVRMLPYPFRRSGSNQ